MIQCPKCRTRLSRGEDSYVCNACGNYYPFRKGILFLIPLDQADFVTYIRDRTYWASRSDIGRLIADALGKFDLSLVKKDDMLELASGEGEIGREIVEAFRNIKTNVCADLNLPNLEAAQKYTKNLKTKYFFILYNLEKKLPFEDQSFDIVLLIDVLYFINNDKQLFSEVFRVLRRNGTFVFSFYHTVDPHTFCHIVNSDKLDPIFRTPLIFVPRRFRRAIDERVGYPTLSYYEKVIRDAGFKDVHFARIFEQVRLLIFDRRTLNSVDSTEVLRQYLKRESKVPLFNSLVASFLCRNPLVLFRLYPNRTFCFCKKR